MDLPNSNLETDVFNPVGKTAQIASSTVIEIDYEPFVRFADNELEQKPQLHHITDPIPDSVSYASPIYYLNSKERVRQDRLDNPYAVSDRCVGVSIQNTAENERREYYPIYVESDADVRLDTQVEWIRQFARDKLNINPEDCNWYFSGGRSIHLHTPYLAKQSDLPKLRELAKEYQHDLDPQIYSKKRQFRLPGPKHATTDLPKVEINPQWKHERIVREATTTDPQVPETYADVLAHTFGSDVLERPQRYLWEAHTDVNPGLNEWETRSNAMGYGTFQIWKSHYSEPVSPYANAGGGDRSLLVAKVKDGPFEEKRESHYNGRDEPQIFVPCEVFRFWSCDREFKVQMDHRPVRLSKTDYNKFTDSDISEGDFFVLISGQSRSSILHTPSVLESKTVAGGESFKEAIDTLKIFEYNTGQSTKVKSQYQVNFENDNQTRSGRIQNKAERDGIDTLSHGELLLLANRLLKSRGVNDTRQWFKDQYGDEYDRELTNQQLKSICDKYDDLPEYHGSNITRSEI